MELGDGIERADRLAAAAMAEMARHQIAPTPNNYLIWYCHCSGRYPDLSRVLRILVSKGEPISEERCAELYDHFFGSDREARLTEETCTRIERNMVRLLEQVDGLSEDTGHYGRKLADFKDELKEGGQLEQIRTLVSGVLDDTRAMQDRASRLETEFLTTSRQIAGLREDLASALRDANTDALTGIANRKHFDQALRIALDHALESGEPAALALFDIDHFKGFNDDHGHQVGDQVLKIVARTLTTCIKGRDLAARYGGEEFALILPQTGLDGARTLGEQIRATVAGNHIRLKLSGRSLGALTLSVGCAEYVPGEPPSTFLRRADEALYEAKRQGRNRVVAAPARLSTLDRAPTTPDADRSGAHQGWSEAV